MIAAENGRSADTYAVTSRAPPVPAHAVAPPTIASAAAPAQTIAARLLRSIHKIIERRDAVRLRPDAHLSRILERVVVPVERFLAVERHREMGALKIHTQRMPLVGRHLQARPLLLGPAAVDRVVDGDVVLERVRSRDVVVVGVLRAPDQAAGLVLLAGDRLELHFDEPVLEAGIVFQAHRLGGLYRLLS